jgi:uncharacterized protein YyaL (SSP411 family)
MPNRLAAEQSPYLLQHKDNPVDWFPWGEPAFEEARRADKPIFLSIGYSTCHWCHVMEHESFENPEIAELLNRHFVPIKVDREERPDVDRVYMTFVQVTTGSGGWPMSVWLTPALEPFYGGTYFPPTSRWGRPGFSEVLEEIARVWRDERPNVDQSARAIVERLRSIGGATGLAVIPEANVLDDAVREFAMSFDRRHGGFGAAPKFPRPSELLFLLREHHRTGADEPREMVASTLLAMANGGMRDHLGGGFHRYSVDAEWRVPHFEKMLYDQAQLVLAYLEGAQAAGSPFFREVAADTLQYVARDLTHADGGFYSAEDADSIPPEQALADAPHKREGAFYVWTDAEITSALGDDDAAVFRLRYGIRPGGNAPFDPQNEFTSQNLLYVARTVEDVASATGRAAFDVEQSLARSRTVLLDIRDRRPRPHLDDKVLTAWNGLMIAAFARAARVMNDPQYLAAAERAAAFIRRVLWHDTPGRLVRRFRDGVAGVDGYAEDYAYLVYGLLELFQTGGDPAWLEWAMTLQRRMDDLFWDEEEGGWFSTTGADPSVLLRLKEDYDGAEPAASSVGALNLLTLSHLTGDERWAQYVERTLATAGARPSIRGRSAPMMMAALSTYHAGMTQVVIAGEAEADDTRALQAVLGARYVPNALVVPVVNRHREALASLLPWTQPLVARDGRATAYVCREFVCRTPTSSAEELTAQLVRPA